MPLPDSWLIFGLALLPVATLAVIWHEAGHAALGLASGLRIVAWGVGVQRPWFRCRLGPTIFYIGWPLTGGLTLYGRRLIEPEPLPEFFCILGGPLASFAGAGAGMAAWWWGIRSDVLVAWIFISVFFFLTSAIPRTWQTSGMRLDNDARLLFDILRHGRAAGIQSIGPVLASCIAMAELLDKLRARGAASYYRLMAGVLESSLGNFEAARQRVATAENGDPADTFKGPALLAFVRAVVALEANADDAQEHLQAARGACQADATALFMLDALHEQWRHAHGQEVVAELIALRDRAVSAARPDWEAIAEQLLFAVDPRGSNETRCRDLLYRFERFIPDTEQARLLAIATERVASGESDAHCKSLFDEAQRRITSAASLIADPHSRAAFIQRAGAPLLRAVKRQRENQIPLFIDDVPTVVSAVSATKKRGLFSGATLMASIVAATIAISYMVAKGPDAPASRETAELWTAMVVLAWTTSLVSGLVAILRQEGRLATVFGALLLATLALLLAVVITMGDRLTEERRSLDDSVAWGRKSMFSTCSPRPPGRL